VTGHRAVRGAHEPLRVLWFANTVPRPWRVASTIPIGHWLDELEEELHARDDVELAVAGLCDQQPGRREVDGRPYFGILRPDSRRKLGRAWSRWTGRLDTTAAVQGCLRVIDEFRPEIVHVHGTERFFGEVGSRTPVPCAISIQGLLTDIAPVYLKAVGTHRLDWIDWRRLATGTSMFNYAADMARRVHLEQAILRAASDVCGRTEWDRQRCLELAPRARYHHLDELLRRPFYGPRWTPHESRGELRLYTTMGAAPYKGLETIVEAVAHIKSSGLKGVRLRIGGNLDQSELGRACRAIARRLGVADCIEELGSLDADAIVRELLACDVYVSASHADNSPNSLCEAQLLGVPCAAASVGGVPTLLEDGRAGALFADSDSAQLAELLCRLAADPRCAEALGARAARIAAVRHDRGRVIASAVELYQSIAQHRASAD